MSQSAAMLRNAVAFDGFCLECEQRGLKVTVGLNAPLLLEVRVRSRNATGRDPVALVETVTGTITDTIALLRSQIGMAA